MYITVTHSHNLQQMPLVEPTVVPPDKGMYSHVMTLLGGKLGAKLPKAMHHTTLSLPMRASSVVDNRSPWSPLSAVLDTEPPPLGDAVPGQPPDTVPQYPVMGQEQCLLVQESGHPDGRHKFRGSTIRTC